LPIMVRQTANESGGPVRLPFSKVFRQGLTSHVVLFPGEPGKAVERSQSWVAYEPGCVNGGATGVTLFFLSKVHEQPKWENG